MRLPSPKPALVKIAGVNDAPARVFDHKANARGLILARQLPRGIVIRRGQLTDAAPLVYQDHRESVAFLDGM